MQDLCSLHYHQRRIEVLETDEQTVNEESSQRIEHGDPAGESQEAVLQSVRYRQNRNRKQNDGHRHGGRHVTDV